jgi:protein phosphatase
VKARLFTDRGGERERNEDAVLCGGLVAREVMEEPYSVDLPEGGFLAAVADGMGGGPGGAAAAAAVVRNLAAAETPEDWGGAPEMVSGVLARTAEEFVRLASENPELSEMGTAVAGLWVRGDRALAFNCGDCRVYRIRHGYFDLLTKDHSLVYELYASGVIDEEDMAAHRLKHILTSSVQDCPEPPRVFFREVSVLDTDSYFICSDGVWEAVTRAEMELVAASGGPEEAAAVMARALKARSCRDNTSFLWLY